MRLLPLREVMIYGTGNCKQLAGTIQDFQNHDPVKMRLVTTGWMMRNQRR
ncbi:hypothetical protein RKLH11_3409 [Rhodobacteraceae bacterium KLH11]|nr:hypothetical protein RKLH11_3409 [Rhodobacteraceae bacterium KLH11]